MMEIEQEPQFDLEDEFKHEKLIHFDDTYTITNIYYDIDNDKWIYRIKSNEIVKYEEEPKLRSSKWRKQ